MLLQVKTKIHKYVFLPIAIQIKFAVTMKSITFLNWEELFSIMLQLNIIVHRSLDETTTSLSYLVPAWQIVPKCMNCGIRISKADWIDWVSSKIFLYIFKFVKMAPLQISLEFSDFKWLQILWGFKYIKCWICCYHCSIIVFSNC
jgi:hypothetical protein